MQIQTCLHKGKEFIMNNLKFKKEEIKEIFTEMLQQTMNRKKANLQRLKEVICELPKENEQRETILQVFELYNQTLTNLIDYQYILSYEQPLHELSYLLEQEQDLLFNKILEITELEEFWNDLDTELRRNDNDKWTKNLTDKEIEEEIDKAVNYLLSKEYQEEIEIDYELYENIE